MTSACEQRWIALGRPRYGIAYPVADLTATLRRYGYTVGTIGNQAHMEADPPEDHTWYSATGWPLPAEYGYEYALDLMPGGPVDWQHVAAQIVADKINGVSGTEWIKYVNWTPPGASSPRHESWEPGHKIGSSRDSGHMHISCRTDFLRSRVARGYDPIARYRAGGSVVPVVYHPPVIGGVPRWPGRVLIWSGGRMMHGTDVLDAQNQLIRLGYHLGTSGPRHNGADGLYGPHTAGAVGQFQRDANGHGYTPRLAVDSKVGPMTWRAVHVSPLPVHPV